MKPKKTISLNSKQQEAVHQIARPTLVLAGAGSGKTGVITSKIIYLIRDCNYHAKNIVALTFTNKAAREMKERINRQLLKSETKGLWLSTFHTLGLRILKEDGHLIGLRKGFSIFDQKDCLEILKEITQLDDKEIKVLQSHLSNYKNNGDYPSELEAHLSATAEIYNTHLLALNAVDFDDLIIHCLTLFEHHPESLGKWQRRIRYLLLDEYQDTNQTQYRLVKYLAGLSGHFTAVGDDDQSIYSWRGADANNLKMLTKDFPNLEVIKLEQNYRCDYRILSASNMLIANNPHLFEKKLWSEIKSGDVINVSAYETEDEEAQIIASHILTQVNRSGCKLSDFAILYRGNYQSRAIEKQLRVHQLSYQINGATSFFEHTEIRDLIAYLRVIANPDDQRAFVRIVNTPKREIGTTTLQKLSEYSLSRNISLLNACQEYGLKQTLSKPAQEKLYEFSNWLLKMNQYAEQGESPLQILDWVIGDHDYLDYVQSKYNENQGKRKVELIHELRDWISRLQDKDDINSLSDIIQRMLLLDMLEQKNDSEVDSISLMTLHSAKGLEFPYVFIVGLEEGLIPHQNCIEEEHLIEEERRLLYVGMTRAKYKLWLSLANNRRIAGNLSQTTPSRFLAELPYDEIEWQGIYEKELSEEEQQKKMDTIFEDLFAIVNDK